MAETLELLSSATWETVYMVAVSVLTATVFGIPLGVLLYATDRNQILQNYVLNKIRWEGPLAAAVCRFGKTKTR